MSKEQSDRFKAEAMAQIDAFRDINPFEASFLEVCYVPTADWISEAVENIRATAEASDKPKDVSSDLNKVLSTVAHGIAAVMAPLIMTLAKPGRDIALTNAVVAMMETEIIHQLMTIKAKEKAQGLHTV